MKNYWQSKLTAFDAELIKMVESLTGKPCEPKNGGNHYFFEADYGNHINEVDYILALWDAIEGQTGKRLLEFNDSPERHSLFVYVKFYEDGCPDAAFVPKTET